MPGYRELVVWQRSVELACLAYRCTETFPDSEPYGITAQARRAAVSVPCNIAEGQGRARPGEFLNQLSCARGCLQEFETLLIISERLRYITSARLESVLAETDQISRMLLQLRRSLSR